MQKADENLNQPARKITKQARSQISAQVKARRSTASSKHERPLAISATYNGCFRDVSLIRDETSWETWENGYPLARNQYINNSPGIFSCIRAGANTSAACIPTKMNSPPNMGNIRCVMFPELRHALNSRILGTGKPSVRWETDFFTTTGADGSGAHCR